jgi:RNA polymerase sigma-70 factor (ECF subfamily)
LLERKLDELPEAFRVVFVLRSVEEMSVEETAQCLAIPEATVRSRHFRARACCANHWPTRSISPSATSSNSVVRIATGWSPT